MASGNAGDDQDFNEALCVFAEGALQHRAKRLIIDMRQFMGRPSDQVGAWRDEVIVPKYVKAGVKKIAYLLGIEICANAGPADFNPRSIHSVPNPLGVDLRSRQVMTPARSQMAG